MNSWEQDRYECSREMSYGNLMGGWESFSSCCVTHGPETVNYCLRSYVFRFVPSGGVLSSCSTISNIPFVRKEQNLVRQLHTQPPFSAESLKAVAAQLKVHFKHSSGYHCGDISLKSLPCRYFYWEAYFVVTTWLSNPSNTKSPGNQPQSFGGMHSLFTAAVWLAYKTMFQTALPMWSKHS